MYLYQARHLPAMDEDAATCPCKVTLMVGGEQAQQVDDRGKTLAQKHSNVVTQSLNPMWYEVRHASTRASE